MTKIVKNVCYGGFGLSQEAMLLWCKLRGEQGVKVMVPPKGQSCCKDEELVPWDGETQPPLGLFFYQNGEGEFLDYLDMDRDDPHLVEVVETLGRKAWGRCAELEVVEIPDDVVWEIEEYDGYEAVREVSRTW